MIDLDRNSKKQLVEAKERELENHQFIDLIKREILKLVEVGFQTFCHVQGAFILIG